MTVRCSLLGKNGHNVSAVECEPARDFTYFKKCSKDLPTGQSVHRNETLKIYND